MGSGELVTWNWRFEGKLLDWFGWRKALNDATAHEPPLSLELPMHHRWAKGRQS